MSVKDNTYEIAALQDKMLDLLKAFIKICDEYGLRYWLAGGSCLGALRHRGFIPWDDDLDVYMPRPDYEKIWRIMGNRPINGLQLCRTSEEKNYHHRVMQLVDLNTTFIHSRCKDEDLEHGIYIDIIPLDGRPKRKMARIAQFVDAVIYSIFNIQCRAEYNGGKLTTIMNLGSDVLLSLIRKPSTRYRIWRAAEKRMTRYDWDQCEDVICLISRFNELCTHYKKEWFAEREVLFEDIIAVIPKQAEEYCKVMYGDYMKLPPVEGRKPRHNTEFIDLETPYTRYKGVYYCKAKDR